MNAPRFLLVSLSNIGDAVMTTPVLEALHAFEPHAIIDIVGDRRSSEIFTACPFLGRLLHKDKRGVLRGLPALVVDLRKVHYDLAVDLRTDFLPLLLHARRRLHRWQRRRFGPHAVQQHLGVLAALGMDVREFPQRIWLRNADHAFARAALGASGGSRLLALGPGANWPPKIWPARNFIELIATLQARFDAVVLLGGPADRIHAGTIAASSALPCINLAGATGLLEAAAVLSLAQVFVGNDSGLGHLAAAVRTPTLTLFGPGDPDRYHPWGAQAEWLAQPERDIGRLPVAAVRVALDALLGRLASTSVPAAGN